MKKELISIIIPIYNIEKYLKRCVNSLLNQTYKNIEIILVNDGSTDNSPLICKEYEKNYKDKIVYLNKKNSGVSEARNYGLQKAKGKFVTFIDADDYVKEGFIEKLYEQIKDDKTVLVISNAVNFDDEQEYEQTIQKKEQIKINKEQCIKELFLEKNFFSVCWGKLYKTEQAKKIKFDKTMKIAEDLKYVMNYLENCKENDNIIIIPDKLYYYYLRQGSAIRSGFDERWIDEINLCSKYIEKSAGTSYYKYAIRRYIRINVTCAVKFNLDKEKYKYIRKNLLKYKKEYLSFNEVSIKEKIKFLIILTMYPIIKHKRGV